MSDKVKNGPHASFVRFFRENLETDLVANALKELILSKQESIHEQTVRDRQGKSQ